MAGALYDCAAIAEKAFADRGFKRRPFEVPGAVFGAVDPSTAISLVFEGRVRRLAALDNLEKISYTAREAPCERC